MVKKFQGSWCVMLILLLIGIIPGIIYYAIKYEEVTPIIVQQQAPQQQVVIVQQPATPQPTIQNKKFCSECGAEVTGKFCDKCGSEIK